MSKLDQRVVIITGASRGIGAAAARAFAASGAKMVLAARNSDALETLARVIRKAGGDALPVPTDVAESASVERLVSAVVKTYGRLDAAFNNAGEGHTPRPLAEISLEDFDRTVAVIRRGFSSA